MTEQRIFPFFVNGEFWKTMEVSEDEIKRGEKIYHVTKRFRISKESRVYPTTDLIAKKVIFSLTEVREYYPDNFPLPKDCIGRMLFRNYMARWFSGFWLVDKDIEIEDNRLFLREQK